MKEDKTDYVKLEKETRIEERINEVISEIFYHVLAWNDDEGDYQPTMGEATEAIRKELKRMVKKILKEVQ